MDSKYRHENSRANKAWNGTEHAVSWQVMVMVEGRPLVDSRLACNTGEWRAFLEIFNESIYIVEIFAQHVLFLFLAPDVLF